MAIKIVQSARSPEYDLSGINIDLTRKTGVLIRQSRKGADLDSRESRLRQESLVPVAIALRGDADGTNISLYDEGSGVSGTKGYDQRPELSRLYMDIANDVIGSIVVARADRLFRDKHFRNVSMFTELAERKHLIVIVPGKAIYDFTKTRDLQAFQREMQEAYNYIATQVAYMQDTRRRRSSAVSMVVDICLRHIPLTGPLLKSSRFRSSTSRGIRSSSISSRNSATSILSSRASPAILRSNHIFSRTHRPGLAEIPIQHADAHPARWLYLRRF